MQDNRPVVPEFHLSERQSDVQLTAILSFMVLTAVVTLVLLPYSPATAETFFVAAGAMLLVALAVIGN